MTAWRAWHEMARESERAARLAEAEGCLRSAASRYYYAAYQAATALLLYRGLTPPQGREAWSHEDTPFLMEHDVASLVARRDTRLDLSRRLRQLYKLRLMADYQGMKAASAGQAAHMGRDTRYMLSTIQSILPEKAT